MPSISRGDRDFAEVERKHGLYEVKAHNAEDQMVGRYISAKNGDVQHSKYKD